MAGRLVAWLRYSFHRRHATDGLVTEVQADVPSENVLS